MIKINAKVFMSWFGQITDNENLEFKIIAIREFKDNFYKASGRTIYFVNEREITLTDEQVFTYSDK